MSAGQRAMARALLKPEGEKGGRGKKLSSNGERLSASDQNSISRARFILRHDEHLARSVMNGSISLNEAYKSVNDRVDAENTEEERRRSDEEDRNLKLNDLRARHPNLARRVEEDGLSLKAMLVVSMGRNPSP
jgi:hypothetical protein